MRAKKNQAPCNLSRDILLIDMFRIVNQLFLILDSLILSFNTVGRYYKHLMPVYQQIYKLFHM